MSEGKLQVINSKKQNNQKRFMLVKVGTDTHPGTDEDIENMKEQLKSIIEATSKDFEWVFVTNNVNIESLTFEGLSD